MSHYATIQAVSPATVSRPAPVRAAGSVLPTVFAVLAAVMLVLVLCFGWVAAQGWTERGLDRAAGVPVAALVAAQPLAS